MSVQKCLPGVFIPPTALIHFVYDMEHRPEILTARTTSLALCIISDGRDEIQKVQNQMLTHLLISLFNQDISESSYQCVRNVKNAKKN